MEDAENHRYEEQCRHGGEDQSADDSAPQRRILLTTLPNPSAIGTMPMIIANAVISTGRRRTNPASSAALVASPVRCSCSRAKLITSTLLAVATPMHMIAPVSAGTDKVVCVANSTQTMPANAAGSAVMITKGSVQDWKLMTMSR
jgi:hypothetical protein